MSREPVTASTRPSPRVTGAALGRLRLRCACGARFTTASDVFAVKCCACGWRGTLADLVPIAASSRPAVYPKTHGPGTAGVGSEGAAR